MTALEPNPQFAEGGIIESDQPELAWITDHDYCGPTLTAAQARAFGTPDILRRINEAAGDDRA